MDLRWRHIECLFIIFVVQNYSRAILFKMTNVNCESYNKSWATIELCRLKAYKRNKPMLNINVTVLHPAYRIHVKGKILKKANGYKPWLYDFTIDGCEFLKKHNHPVAKIVYNLFKNTSTINHTCPYMGHQGVKDFYLRAEALPGVMPTGEYLLLITWLFDKRPQFATNVYFEFVENLI